MIAKDRFYIYAELFRFLLEECPNTTPGRHMETIKGYLVKLAKE